MDKEKNAFAEVLSQSSIGPSKSETSFIGSKMEVQSGRRQKLGKSLTTILFQ
jgi:hypothetical protein